MKKQTSLLLWENVLWWASEWSPFTVFSPVTQNAKHYSIFKKFIYEYKERKKKKINKKSSISIVKYTLTSKTKSSIWFLFILRMFQVKSHVTKSIETNIKMYITKDIKMVCLGFLYLVIFFFLKLIYSRNMYSIQIKSKKNKERTHKRKCAKIAI